MNNWRNYFKYISYRLLLLWLLLSLYVIFHEAGHGLIVLLFGGQITYFNINLFNAQVSYAGDFSTWQQSLIHLAGFGLPFLLWVLFIFRISDKIEHPIIKYIKVYSGVVISTLIPWVIIPILFLFNKAPAGDDVTKFLNISGLPVLLVSLIFLCLILFSFYIWRQKTKSFTRMIFLENNQTEINKKSFRVLITLSLLFLVLMAFPWVTNNIKPQVGEGYQLLAQTPNLSQLEKGEWELSKFWVDEAKKSERVDILIVGKNVSAKIFELKLESSDEIIIPFADSREITSDTIKYNQITTLKSGEYRFMMNAEDIEGYLYIYLKRN